MRCSLRPRQPLSRKAESYEHSKDRARPLYRPRTTRCDWLGGGERAFPHVTSKAVASATWIALRRSRRAARLALGRYLHCRLQVMQRDHKRTLVKEYWRWRYRDPRSGRICRTTFQLTEDGASGLLEAERIEGSMSLLEVEDDDFAETGPDVHPLD